MCVVLGWHPPCQGSGQGPPATHETVLPPRIVARKIPAHTGDPLGTLNTRCTPTRPSASFTCQDEGPVTRGLRWAASLVLKTSLAHPPTTHRPQAHTPGTQYTRIGRGRRRGYKRAVVTPGARGSHRGAGQLLSPRAWTLPSTQVVEGGVPPQRVPALPTHCCSSLHYAPLEGRGSNRLRTTPRASRQLN